MPTDLYLSPLRDVTSQSAVKSKAVFSFVIKISPLVVFYQEVLFVPSLSNYSLAFATSAASDAKNLPYICTCVKLSFVWFEMKEHELDIDLFVFVTK